MKEILFVIFNPSQEKRSFVIRIIEIFVKSVWLVKNLVTQPKIEILLKSSSTGDVLFVNAKLSFISPSSRHKPLSGVTYGSPAQSIKIPDSTKQMP